MRSTFNGGLWMRFGEPPGSDPMNWLIGEIVDVHPDAVRPTERACWPNGLVSLTLFLRQLRPARKEGTRLVGGLGGV